MYVPNMKNMTKEEGRGGRCCEHEVVILHPQCWIREDPKPLKPYCVNGTQKIRSPGSFGSRFSHSRPRRAQHRMQAAHEQSRFFQSFIPGSISGLSHSKCFDYTRWTCGCAVACAVACERALGWPGEDVWWRACPCVRVRQMGSSRVRISQPAPAHSPRCMLVGP